MTDATGRAQDQGRRHRRKGQPTAETATLLADAQSALRDELRADLDDLRGPLPDTSLVELAAGEVVKRQRPPLRDRAPLVDLIVKIMRELGTEIDAGGATPADPDDATCRPRRRTRRIDFG